MAEKQEKGLSSATVGLMIGTALFFDFLQFLLGFIYLGWLVGIFAGLTFWFWFRTKGIHIGFGKPKRLAFFGLASLIEMLPIPLLADLPAWTAYVVPLALSNKFKGLGEGITKLDIMKK